MSTQSRKTILLATDQQQSVLNALDAKQPHPIAYAPYGHRIPENGLLSLLGFNGELPDPLTGHYHLGKGYRQFNPVLMRFNSPDSWSPFGEGGLNAYVYGLGDPANSTDPSGHMAIFKKTFKALKSTKAPKPDLSKNVSTVVSSTTEVAPKKTGKITNPESSSPQDRKPNGLTPAELNLKLNSRYKNQPQNFTNLPHKGKHVPPKPSPSIHDGVDTESYKKFATLEQLHLDYNNSRAILDALKDQPSTSKPLQDFAIIQKAIDIRFAQ